MLKKISIFILVMTGAAYAATTTYTAHYNLAKPADGSTTWGAEIRDDLDTIDTQLFVNATTVNNHIADTVGAHQATAISTTAGGLTCTSSLDVQSFLTCLDTNFGSIIGGGVVTIVGDQTIGGNKTFSGNTVFDGSITANSSVSFANGMTAGGTVTLSGLGSGVVKSNGSGVLSSSAVVDADIDASAAIDRTMVAAGTTNRLIYNDGSTGLLSDLSALTSTSILYADSNGLPTSEAALSYAAGSNTVTTDNVRIKSSLLLEDPSGGTDAVTLQAPTLSGGLTLTLPNSAGSAGYVLTTDGSGNLDWEQPSGGGGGSTIEWSSGDNGAVVDYHPDVGAKMYRFPSGGTALLVGFIRVPQSYLVGNPITLRIGTTQVGGSGTLLLGGTSFLIPPGTAFSSTTDGHLSTNTAQSAASLAYVQQTIDITDSSGEINGNAVNAGDLIRVVLARRTDTAVGDLLMMSSTTEVTFQ